MVQVTDTVVAEGNESRSGTEAVVPSNTVTGGANEIAGVSTTPLADPAWDEKRARHLLDLLGLADKADAHVSEQLLREDAEKALYAATQRIASQAGSQFESGDYTGSLQTLAALRAPVDAFFDQVVVNDADPQLHRNRLRLLNTLCAAMDAVADVSKIEG